MSGGLRLGAQSNRRCEMPVRASRFPHRVFNKGVKISGLSYGSATDQVTIRLARAVKGKVRINVHGGIMATNGLSSLGDFTAVVN